MGKAHRPLLMCQADGRLENATLVEPLISTTTSLAGVHSALLPFPHTHLILNHSPALISLRTIVDSLTAAFPQLTFLPTSELRW